jgi:hypothetical protein
MQPSKGGTPEDSWRQLSKRLSVQLRSLIEEAFGTLAAIALIALVDFVSARMLGDQPRFFDFIPVKWVFDLAHLIVICRLIWKMIKRFNEE